MIDDNVTDDSGATTEQPEPNEGGDSVAPVEEPADPDEALRQKYRDALAHKHGSSGAAQKGHGDAGSSGHSQSAGPTQRLFRRKAGG